MAKGKRAGEAADCVIVATSTLELGLDIGDLDRVVQIDAPNRVASFLQKNRMYEVLGLFVLLMLT